ncbi:MAG TPA: amino acid ABC transporter permease [Candidatus Polarisedimenticolia bacterium]|nr:amino acid ABC transporter permease [Candidatus Polarisedimenticolia bacterium]
MTALDSVTRKSGSSFWHNEFIRGIIFQVVVGGIILAAVIFFVHNTATNLAKRGIASGFDFLTGTSGFDISISLIPYSLQSTYGTAFIVGLLNTLLVSAIGIVLATIIGFIVGVARLSKNFLIAKLAAAYVDVIRNIPLLAQIIFWYFGVLTSLPSVRQSISVFGVFFLNGRGLYMPAPILQPGFWVIPAAFVLAIVATFAIARWSRRRQDSTGQQFPVIWTGLGLILGLPIAAGLLAGIPVTWSLAQLHGFNFIGGMDILPEFVALLLALSIYTAAFIAEIVRGGIQAISHGQTEAAHALGLSTTQTTRLVVLPQALRIIVPPLTSQYLNLTKNSSLAVIIGYPELVSVFMGTVLNQTGQAVEVIAITMGVYLVISLVISAFMNWYNRHIALVER